MKSIKYQKFKMTVAGLSGFHTFLMCYKCDKLMANETYLTHSLPIILVKFKSKCNTGKA